MNISSIVFSSVCIIFWIEIFMNGVVLNGMFVFILCGSSGVSLVMCLCIVVVVCIVFVFGCSCMLVVVVG